MNLKARKPERFWPFLFLAFWLPNSFCFCDLLRRIGHARDTELIQDALDFVVFTGEGGIDFVVQLLVALTHAHRDAEGEGQVRIACRTNWNDLERDVSFAREVAS